jgi:hypothetical protein
MNKIRLIINGLAITIFMLAFGSIAQAQATRTWVSGVGDDANPCSRTAPCKTFAGAISKTATGGEIDVLDPGGFGAVTITKSISIENTGNIAGVLVSGTNGIVISAPSNSLVVLRGLTIEGLGTGLSGIKFQAGGGLYVEHCFINNFTQRGIEFAPNQATNSQLTVKDTFVRNNLGINSGGIMIEPSGGGAVLATIDHVRCENNLFGFQARDNSRVTISNSVASGNTNNGFAAASVAGLPVDMNLDHSVSSNNGGVNTNGGVKAVNAGATIRISNMIITNNAAGLIAAGGSILSLGNNHVAGNNGNDGSPTGTITPK